MDRYGTWILEQIKECSPETGGSPYLAEKLGEAAAVLAGHGGQLFGMVMPAQLADREELLATAVDALRRWLPKLEAPQLAFLAPLVERAKLPIDLSPYVSQIASAQQQMRAKRRTAAKASEPHNPELERAIVDSPDDRDAYAVLADWLESQGSPRGELIALQLRAEKDPAVQKDVDKFLDDHADVLLGPLIDHVKVHDGSNEPAFTWRRGYIHRARLAYDDYGSRLAVGLDEVLELLLQHPSGRLVGELVLGRNGEPTDNTLDDLIAVIAEEQPVALRSLFLGDFEYPDETEMSWFTVGDASPLWPALPRLVNLIVQGGSFELGDIALPALEHVELRTGGLSAANARAVASARWPKLRHLEVWYGDSGYGGDATIEDVLPLLARRDLPALVHLGLRNAELTDAICKELAKTPPILATVRELDLSMGTMSDTGAAALADAGLQFDVLDVSQNWLTDEGIARLRPMAKTLIASDQNEGDDEDDRHPTVGE